MSANNWTRCPQCMRKQSNAFAKVQELYGCVPADEYARLLDEARKPVTTRQDTFREDYEIGVYKDALHIDYSGSCEECGFGVQFKHTQSVFKEQS